MGKPNVGHTHNKICQPGGFQGAHPAPPMPSLARGALIYPHPSHGSVGQHGICLGPVSIIMRVASTRPMRGRHVSFQPDGAPPSTGCMTHDLTAQLEAWPNWRSTQLQGSL